ncbi:MAG: diguanylate cyclase [Alphaproteobacteria bacterium]|nr:diguanylate cyclase [Alphaproteobacteria bacterium]
MLIRELLAKRGDAPVQTIEPECTLFDLSVKLRKHDIGALLVVDGRNTVVGVVSERDVVRAITKFDDGLVRTPVADIMTRSVITCAPGDDVVDTLELMNRKHIRHMPVLDQGKPLAMISIREFDSICRHLQVQSRTDELTGLANRRYFLEMLETEIARSRRYHTPLSLAILDIDHFKHINDTLGHDAGDTVLCDLGKLLVRELRTFDGIGRLGGEEFAILFANTPAANAKLACERLISAIRAREVITSDGSTRYTASFGLTDAGTDTPDGQALLKAADKLLYQAKNEGRNRVVARQTDPQSDPMPGFHDSTSPTASCEAREVTPYTAT